MNENKKIVFSREEEPHEETVVTITLTELDIKSTVIEVTESGFKEEDSELLNKLIGQKKAGFICYLV
nr:hypothetical protein [Neobacillus cucumis]